MTSAIQTSKTDPVPHYAQVAVPVHLSKTFTYRLPASMRTAARVGSRVIVPLGRKPLTGYIVGLLPNLRPGTSLVESEIKDVHELLDAEPPLTPEVLAITRWVADYYSAPLGEVMRAALPAGINTSVEEIVSITADGRAAIAVNQSQKPSVATRALQLLAGEGEIELNAFNLRMGSAKTPKWLRELEQQGLLERTHRSRSITRAKRRKAVRLRNRAATTGDENSRPRITPAQQRALDALRANQNEMIVADLRTKARVSESVIRTLIKHGAIEEFEMEVRRDPLAQAELSVTRVQKLNDAQAQALHEIEMPMRQSRFAGFLLHGVTGSGKTEVYLRAMHAALEMNRGAMMLVPEIALTPILSRRLRAEFGDQIAIFHSSLSKGERFDEWSRLRRGEARVVLGTRSAVFAPVERLGLLVVDEEHDTSYRQEESPFYNARDTAIVRAQKESAVVVLGSATPSLESFHNSQSGKYQYLQLPERIASRPLARAQLIDMREVFARRKRATVFSDELLTAIQETHARSEQTIILLNRRGYSSFILCRSCGESIMCPNCDVTLTYHRSDRTLVCHYCNHRELAPSQCLVCGSKFIYYVGEGTEQIDELLRRRFPELRIGRIDRDTKSRRHAFEKTLLDFSKGELDLLVGTQMLAKGHDFPNVTLVGVISVDAGLALPDFRAAERAFQLITQVAGRAGRGDKAGRVLIQTYHPQNYALRHASAQDYRGFYEEEIRHRRNHGYPPFVALALLLSRHQDSNRAHSTANDLRKALIAANHDQACRILGPAPAPLARLRGEYRVQLLVKSRSRKQLRAVIDEALASMETAGRDLRAVTLEIDPVSMM
ncbi:MAG: primosomal protein N' [Acidobacteria bacterium]|nr:MAG: primosomal protein N' [Acidobacteriota bacterium]